MVVMTEAGDVQIRIRAFSRPSSLTARAGGRLNRMIHVRDRPLRERTPTTCPR
jgi:hypothetical protein